MSTTINRLESRCKEAGAEMLAHYKGEQSVHNTREVAVVLVGVCHSIEGKSLHDKMQQAVVEHSQKPVIFSLSFKRMTTH